MGCGISKNICISSEKQLLCAKYNELQREMEDYKKENNEILPAALKTELDLLLLTKKLKPNTRSEQQLNCIKTQFSHLKLKAGVARNIGVK